HRPKLPAPPEAGFDDLYLFANISKQFRSLRFKQPVLGKLMHHMFDSMDADAAFLQLPQKPQYDLLEIRPALMGNNGGADALKDAMQQLVTGGIRQCSGNYCIMNDSRGEAAFDALSDRPYRFMAVAVRHIKESYGWLGLVSYNIELEFKPEELNILQTLANQLAAMMANMAQHDDLERFTVNIVCSLVNAIEAKDAYTQGHSKRVHQYAMQMAKRLNLPGREVEALRWASVLHDIGKIGIPERILCKPGKLTEKEFNLIKEHPVKGRTILSPIRQLAPSMEAIAHHHERYDGKGYPDGLKGEEIPLAARIIAVADTFDAITSRRSYHPSKTETEALRVLDQVAGVQLDPHLVNVFKSAL
ncbi:MAG: HD-GYP domain-containing protein, partial [Desulfobacteraceae bacterium]